MKVNVKSESPFSKRVKIKKKIAKRKCEQEQFLTVIPIYRKMKFKFVGL
jgi:hypothetical protein